jgi:hypothetical protein
MPCHGVLCVLCVLCVVIGNVTDVGSVFASIAMYSIHTYLQRGFPTAENKYPVTVTVTVTTHRTHRLHAWTSSMACLCWYSSVFTTHRTHRTHSHDPCICVLCVVVLFSAAFDQVCAETQQSAPALCVLCVPCVVGPSDYFPQSGALAEGTSRPVSHKAHCHEPSRYGVTVTGTIVRGK